MRTRPDPKLWEKLRSVAGEMRKSPTKAEAVFWAAIKDGRAGDAKFRRQQAFGRYIVDFYCRSANLVIEFDGPIHNSQVDEDAERQEYLESLGLNVLRFTNDNFLRNIDTSLATVRRIIEGAPL